VEALQDRLSQRGTEDQEKLNLRLTNAITEIQEWPQYRYALVSGSREEDLDRFRALLLAERLRVQRYEVASK
jgi:guanylate kinase